MIPIIRDGKPIGMVSSNFLVEFIGDVVTTQEFNNIFGNCSAKWLDLKLSNLTDDVYVRKAQITEWFL
jgi:hypothetical protein